MSILLDAWTELLMRVVAFVFFFPFLFLNSLAAGIDDARRLITRYVGT